MAPSPKREGEVTDTSTPGGETRHPNPRGETRHLNPRPLLLKAKG